MNKVPNLRFKEFSEDWKAERAGNIFASITDKKHNGDLLVLSATQDRGVIPRNEIGIDIKYEKENLSSYKKVKFNDFIISLRSFQGGIEHSKYEGLVSPAYTVFNFKNECLFNHNFFAILFKSQNFINRLNTLTYGIRDGKAISFTDFSSMKLTYPEDKEQEKIASFFSLIDKKIELQTEKVEELKNYKKGIMQKIFSQELRLKDENGNEYPEWEEEKLGNICDYKNGKTYEEFICENGQYNLISLNSIGIDGKLKKEHKKVNVCDDFLIKGDLIMVLSDVAHGNFLGLTDIIPTDNIYVLNQRMGALRRKVDIDVEWLSKYINYNQRYFKLHGQGSSQLNLSKADILNFKVLIPCLKEQTKIAKVLWEIDIKIEKEQEKLEYLNQYKKGLLQQMFV